MRGSVLGMLLGVVSLLLSSQVQAGSMSSLEVQVTGLRNTQGKVCLSLFSGPKGFPTGGSGSNLAKYQCITLSGLSGKPVVTFSDIPAGSYAIAAIHDSNGDTKLNQNAFGIPTEGFGFSNNPPLRFGPASFAESQVLVSGVKTVVQLQMRYLQ